VTYLDVERGRGSSIVWPSNPGDPASWGGGAPREEALPVSRGGSEIPPQSLELKMNPYPLPCLFDVWTDRNSGNGKVVHFQPERMARGLFSSGSNIMGYATFFSGCL